MSAPLDPQRHQKTAKRLVWLIACGILGVADVYQKVVVYAPRSYEIKETISDCFATLVICLASGICVGAMTQNKSWLRIMVNLIYFGAIFFFYSMLSTRMVH